MGWVRGHGLRIRFLGVLLRATPARRHAVVAGSPDDEGNSVEVVRALAGRIRVYWLVSEDPASLGWLVADAPGAESIRILQRDSLRAWLAYVTARYIFFTHGLYGSAAPPRHKTVVNLWHGDGPKNRKGFARIHASAIVAGTELWGQRRPLIFNMPQASLLVTGNPRVDQFDRPADAEAFRALALPDQPLVLWLPTYRRTDYRGRRLGMVRNWADSDELSNLEAARRFAGQLASAAEAVGVTVAIKPHPLDADSYRELGLPVIEPDDLVKARTTLYQLLGSTRGLITDYSSVWTDYLCLDRPIGFFCPDLERYEATRGLNVRDYEEILPGPLLATRGDVIGFLGDCLKESEAACARRREIAELIGAQRETGATERLLRALGLGPPPGGQGKRPVSETRLDLGEKSSPRIAPQTSLLD